MRARDKRTATDNFRCWCFIGKEKKIKKPHSKHPLPPPLPLVRPTVKQLKALEWYTFIKGSKHLYLSECLRQSQGLVQELFWSHFAPWMLWYGQKSEQCCQLPRSSCFSTVKLSLSLPWCFRFKVRFIYNTTFQTKSNRITWVAGSLDLRNALWYYDHVAVQIICDCAFFLPWSFQLTHETAS